MTSLAVAATVSTVALVVQGAWSYAVRPRRLVGDESEYLSRARAIDPYQPDPFLRVPGMIWLVRRAGTERRARVLMASLGAATAIVTALAVVTHSWQLALVSGAICLFLPDRLLLSHHLWPDVPVAFLHAVVVACVVNEGAAAIVILGVACAALAATRIDTLVVLPAAIALSVPTSLWALALPVPTVAILGLLTLRNQRRYGIAAPDTTALFNLRLMDATTERGERDSLEPTVRDEFSRWSGESLDERLAGGTTVKRLARRPLHTTAGVVRRCWMMLGPDTFGIERMLARDGPYSHLPARARRVAGWVLAVSFPALVSLAAAGFAVDAPASRRLAVLALATYLAISVVHARTRFRLALVPSLSVMAAGAVLAIGESGDRNVAMLVVAFVAALTLTAPRRRER